MEDQEGTGKNNVKISFKEMGCRQYDKVDGTGSG